MRIEQTPTVGRADRIALSRIATLRDPSRAPIDVTIENLSETGALLRSEGALPVGTLVSLGIAGLGMQIARIARAEPGQFACEFMVPLDPTRVAVARSAETLVSVAFPQMLAADAARRAALAAPLVAEASAAPEAVRRGPGLLAALAVAASILIAYLLTR